MKSYEERVEHVAKAILHKSGRPYGWDTCLFHEYEREAWRVIARAAIQAWEETAMKQNTVLNGFVAAVILGGLVVLGVVLYLIWEWISVSRRIAGLD